MPAFLKWPAKVDPGRTEEMTCSTMDYLPTIFAALGLKMPDNRPLDGLDLMPMVEGKMHQRPKALLFRSFRNKSVLQGSPTIALIDGRYKFCTNLSEDGVEDLLFDLDADSREQENLVSRFPVKVARFRVLAREFVDSCRRSHAGEDYGDSSYEPAEAWRAVNGGWAEE